MADTVYQIYDKENELKVQSSLFQIGQWVRYFKVDATTAQNSSFVCPFCGNKYRGFLMGEDHSLYPCPKCDGKGVINAKKAKMFFGKVIGFSFTCNKEADTAISLQMEVEPYTTIKKERINDADYYTVKKLSNVPEKILYKKYQEARDGKIICDLDFTDLNNHYNFDDVVAARYITVID